MRFLDPMPCPCPSYGVESELPVRELMALTAHCPNCNASLREIGLNMRRTADEAAVFFDALSIVVHIEDALGISVTDQTIEAVRPWNDLTLQDLVTAVIRSCPSLAPLEAEQAVHSAVRAEFPDAPELLDFAAPLLDAIASQRHKGVG